MALGWKSLLPISVFNFLIVAIFILLRQEGYLAFLGLS